MKSKNFAVVEFVCRLGATCGDGSTNSSLSPLHFEMTRMRPSSSRIEGGQLYLYLPGWHISASLILIRREEARFVERTVVRDK